MSMQRGNWGGPVSIEERERLAERRASGLARRPMLGRTFGAWKVLRRVGTVRRDARGTDPVWRCVAVCCGQIADKTTNTLHKPRKVAGASSGLCQRCRLAKLAGEACLRRARRACVWCGRRLHHSHVRECRACRRRAVYAGRDETGRPNGKIVYRKRRTA